MDAMQNQFSFSRSARRLTRAGRAGLLGSVAAVAFLTSPALAQDQGTLRVLTMNTWGDQFRDDLDAIKDVFVNGNYDIIAFQELRNEQYLSGLQQILRDEGLGEYEYIRQGDTGVLSRVGGDFATNTQGDSVAYQTAQPGGGVPDTVVGSVHLDYRDPSQTRLNEVRGITEWAKSTGGPVILTGDWNAGDTSERGLHRASQQKLILQNYLRSNNSFYETLLAEYAVDPDAMQDFIDANRGQSLSLDDIPDDLFADETYPVEHNTPVTLNLLKKDFILLHGADREGFEPHDFDDGVTTWPSAGEDDTNTWPSWDRVRIDHFLASRPFGKWYKVVDAADDAYTGTLDQVDVTEDGTAYTDHELVAHDLRWVGPKLEKYDATGEEQTRLVWSDEATTFDENGGEFLLTRNNMRDDVYLGQIADENGEPVLDWLTTEEKKTLLDCTTDDPRLQAAVAEYCIDDHSFIGETLVTAGGTVVVTEDAALGDADATLRLDNGGLAVAGAQMGTLDREISLEGIGGWLDIRDAAAAVTTEQDITGTGALSKRGAGALIVAGDTTYTGETTVDGGALIVNGSTAASMLTTVNDGARLGGTGTTGKLAIAQGGTLGAGNSIGTLSVAGDLSFAEGSTFEIEANAAGEADRVDVTGAVDIQGGSTVVVAEGGNYLPFTSYEVLTAGGGISGTFDGVTSSLAFLDAGLTYGATSLSLELDRNDTAFDSVASTRNGRAAARALEPLGMGNPLFDSVVMLGDASADEAFEEMSGELHAATMGALAEQSAAVTDMAAAKLRDTRDGAETGVQFWFEGYGAGADIDGDDTRDVSRSAYGTLFGANAKLDSGLTFGFASGFGQGETSLDGLRGESETDDLHFALTAGQRFGATAFSLGASYTRSQVSTWRDVSFTGFDETLKADYDADTTQVFAELSHRFTLGTTMLEPFGGLSHVRVETDGASESGGDAALRVKDSEFEASFATLGLRAESAFDAGTTPLRLSGALAWRHVLDASNPEADLAFAGGSAFSVTGTGLAEDAVEIGLGVAMDLSDRAVLSVGYDGAFGDDGQSNAVNLGVQMRF